MKNELDPVNREILDTLSKDGRKPFSSIAAKLGITENTIRARYANITKSGLMRVTAQVDPARVPGAEVVIMGVKLATMDLEDKAKEFMKLRGVLNCAVVTGRYDLIIQVLLTNNEGYGLLDFFKNEVTQIDQVASVESFVVYEAYNYWVDFPAKRKESTEA